jgi:hypothetical protein
VPPPPPAPGTTPTPPGNPAAEHFSVADQLTGLLAANSPYMQQAREAGLRIANRRGLLNTSIAAGNSEAAAIAAAAPIASQDASQLFQRSQTKLEGDIQLRNTTTLQTQQDKAALVRLNAQLSNAVTLQGMGDSAAMQRLIAQGDIEKAIATMNKDASLTQTQINANVSLMSNYMQSISQLAANPDLPADARNAYMAEFLRVSQSTQGLVNALSGTTVTWPTGTTPPPTGTTPPPTPTVTPRPVATGGTGGGGGAALRTGTQIQ